MEVAIRTQTRLTSRAKPIKSKTEKYNNVVAMDNPLHLDVPQKGYTIDESYNRGLDLLSKLYGTDFRKL